MATALSTDDPVLKQVYRDFITGCHILHYHGVLDAFGHLSVRHPHHPDRFIMSRYIAPATISSERDLIEYYTNNAEPVDSREAQGYAERCIHSELYKAYPEINAVIHSHSPEVIPYGISGVKLMPCYALAGFLGTETPVWDIKNHYQSDDIHDFLVRNTRLGGSLASFFDNGQGIPHSVVLMRGHGLTIQAGGIMDVVMRAVYTQQNASVQTTALNTRAASGIAGEDVQYLDEEEARACSELGKKSSGRAWRLWSREVESQGLYVNGIA